MKKYSKLLALIFAGMLFVALRMERSQNTCPSTPDCPCSEATETP